MTREQGLESALRALLSRHPTCQAASGCVEPATHFDQPDGDLYRYYCDDHARMWRDVTGHRVSETLDGPAIRRARKALGAK